MGARVPPEKTATRSREAQSSVEGTSSFYLHPPPPPALARHNRAILFRAPPLPLQDITSPAAVFVPRTLNYAVNACVERRFFSPPNRQLQTNMAQDKHTGREQGGTFRGGARLVGVSSLKKLLRPPQAWLTSEFIHPSPDLLLCVAYFVRIVYTRRLRSLTACLTTERLTYIRHPPQVLGLTEFEPISTASGKKQDPQQTFTQVRGCGSFQQPLLYVFWELT